MPERATSAGIADDVAPLDRVLQRVDFPRQIFLFLLQLDVDLGFVFLELLEFNLLLGRKNEALLAFAFVLLHLINFCLRVLEAGLEFP